MFTSFACSCVRNSKRVSVPFAKLSVLSAGKTSPRSLNLTGRHRSSRPLTPALWQQPQGLTLGSVSRSAASRGDEVPLGSPSVPEDEENFGSLSVDMSSRRSFRKSSPHMQDLRHREGGATEEEDSVKPRRRPGSRNTPYWYFLQCKKLIKGNKVGLNERLNTSHRLFLCSECVYNRVRPLAAAGGFRPVQQRHAAGREAAARGIQLHGTDRRLWSSRTTQKGLQTLQ